MIHVMLLSIAVVFGLFIGVVLIVWTLSAMGAAAAIAGDIVEKVSSYLGEVLPFVYKIFSWIVVFLFILSIISFIPWVIGQYKIAFNL